MESIGYQVDVLPADIDETPFHHETPEALVRRLAVLKAATQPAAAVPVIAADTIVVLGNEILGKPRDDEEARAMLSRLSGREHMVLTGFCVRNQSRTIVDVVRTSVRFRELTLFEIAAYLDTREHLDKAGSYGIQGAGGALVNEIHGSYSNVVGLPVAEVCASLRLLMGTP